MLQSRIHILQSLPRRCRVTTLNNVSLIHSNSISSNKIIRQSFFTSSISTNNGITVTCDEPTHLKPPIFSANTSGNQSRPPLYKTKKQFSGGELYGEPNSDDSDLSAYEIRAASLSIPPSITNPQERHDIEQANRRRIRYWKSRSQQMAIMANQVKAANSPDIKIRENKDLRYQRMFHLFLRSVLWFKARYGHLEIPKTYKLPNQDEYSPPLGTEGYSEVLNIDSTMQGYPLGIAVSKVKSKGAWTREPFVSRLVEIGLLPEPSNLSSFYSARDIFKALEIYQSHYDHLDIPLAYTITPGDESALYASIPGMEGAPLGQMLAAIKKRALYFNQSDVTHRWQKLKIRFERDAQKKLFAIGRESEREADGEREEDSSSSSESDSESSSESESSSDEDEKTVRVRDSKGKSYGKGKREGQDEKSIERDSSCDPQYPHVLLLIEAITIYKQIYPDRDNRHIPQIYRIVGREKEHYPSHLHGFNLGSSVMNLLSRGYWVREPHRSVFIELGIIPPENEELQSRYSVTEIDKAFTGYSNVFGNLDIPREYVIAMGGGEGELPLPPRWKHMNGAPLGEILHAIKARRMHFNSIDVQIWKRHGIKFSSKL